LSNEGNTNKFIETRIEPEKKITKQIYKLNSNVIENAPVCDDQYDVIIVNKEVEKTGFDENG
jgi:hypothetical protein